MENNIRTVGRSDVRRALAANQTGDLAIAIPGAAQRSALLLPAAPLPAVARGDKSYTYPGGVSSGDWPQLPVAQLTKGHGEKARISF